MKIFTTWGRIIAPIVLFTAAATTTFANSKPDKTPQLASARSICVFETDRGDMDHPENPTAAFLSFYQQLAALHRFEFMATARSCDVALQFFSVYQGVTVTVIDPKTYAKLGMIESNKGFFPSKKKSIQSAAAAVKQIAIMSGPAKGSVPPAPPTPDHTPVPFTHFDATTRLHTAKTVFVIDKDASKYFQEYFDTPWVPQEFSNTFLRMLKEWSVSLTPITSAKDADVIMSISAYVQATNLNKPDEAEIDIPTLYVVFYDPMTLMPLCEMDATKFPKRGAHQSFDTHEKIMQNFAGDFANACLQMPAPALPPQ